MFAPPLAILLVTDLEEKILNPFEEIPMVNRRNIDVFNLEIWIRTFGKNYWQFEYFSYNNNISGWVVKRKNVLDVNMILPADFFAECTDKHQFLDPSSSHPYHWKRRIPYSQAVRLNRTSSDIKIFDKHCNDFERQLLERGYE